MDLYSNLIGSREQRERTIDLEGLRILRHNFEMLDTSISEEEVWNTIKQLPSDKAPSPGWFHRKILQIGLADHQR